MNKEKVFEFKCSSKVSVDVNLLKERTNAKRKIVRSSRISCRTSIWIIVDSLHKLVLAITNIKLKLATSRSQPKYLKHKEVLEQNNLYSLPKISQQSNRSTYPEALVLMPDSVRYLVWVLICVRFCSTSDDALCHVEQRETTGIYSSI